MSALPELLLLVTVLVDLYLVSTTRVAACIRAAAVQGAALSLLPLVLEGSGLWSGPAHAVHLILVSAGTLALKSLLIPGLLRKAMRDSGVRREFEPFVSLHFSLLIGAALVGLAFWISGALVAPGAPGATRLTMAVGCATLFVGLYLTISRRKALSQIIGYLVAENGLFAIGLTLPGRLSWLVELGVLLDVLVAIMVMTVLVVHVDGIVGTTDDDDHAAPGSDRP